MPHFTKLTPNLIVTAPGKPWKSLAEFVAMAKARPGTLLNCTAPAAVYSRHQTAQRVVVMYAGRKVEEAGVLELFDRPLHPYTRGLMASMPAVMSLGARSDVRLTEIPGMVPSLTNLPKGCAFAPRCPLAIERCREEYPPMQDFGGHHRAACWRAAELAKAS